jgi:predicted GIY-YIG superfamily endonuclease
MDWKVYLVKCADNSLYGGIVQSLTNTGVNQVVTIIESSPKNTN